METLITCDGLACSISLLALLMVFNRWFIGGDIPALRVLMMFLWLALDGCLILAVAEFPLQIYSILFRFPMPCALSSGLSREA